MHVHVLEVVFRRLLVVESAEASHAFFAHVSFYLGVVAFEEHIYTQIKLLTISNVDSR